jgi:alkylated DNA repair dioxygenase AlkB
MGELAFQPSLLDVGATPRLDAAFRGLIRHDLDDRSWVDHVPGWLAGADALFEELLATGEWRQRERWMYEKRVPEPRLTAGWSTAADADDVPTILREMCGLLSARYGVGFDSVWVNLYRDGADSVAWHGDTNRKTQTNPLVATVTLGAQRRFQLRRRGTTRVALTVEPASGDLLVMGGACQHEWEHTVPKTARRVGPRMSVTIRHSRPQEKRDDAGP